MPPPLKGYIQDQEAAYVQLLLEHINPRIKESGLERLCTLYRRGFRLKIPHPIQQTLNGLLYNSDSGVQRWTLNAIALVGSRKENTQPTLDAIERNRGNEDIVGAAIAALVALTKPDDLIGLLESIGIPLEGSALLAAAQQTDAYTFKLAENRIQTDSASDAELRLAAILIGLNKAPEHLFHLSHKNDAVIGSINRHHDPSVAQYSVWAICENSNLGLVHLGVALPDVESLPENVRGYVFRLITADFETAKKHIEYLKLGSEDPSDKARLGLAAGLRTVYFDGLEELTVPWLGDERSQEVKDHILDHMTAHSERCATYREAALTEYKLAGASSLPRRRLEAVAAGTELFSEFRRIAIRTESGSLFEDDDYMRQKITFNGPATIGSISGDNTKINNATGAAQNNTVDVQEILDALAKLLAKSYSSDDQIAHGNELVANAQKTPSKDTLLNLVGWMKTLKDGACYAVAATEDFQKIYDALHSFLTNF